MTTPGQRAQRRIRLEKMAIPVNPRKSREYFYTNKTAAHFSGETGSGPSRGDHGLCVRLQKLLETWRLQVDGTALDPTLSAGALAYPHQLVRIFQHPSIQEKICLLDDLDVLVVELAGHGIREGVLWPLVDIRPVRQVLTGPYHISWHPQENLLLLGRRSGLAGAPRWLALTADVPMDFVHRERFRPTTYRWGILRDVMSQGTPFEPGGMIFRPRRGRVRFLFVAGHSRRQVRTVVRRSLPQAADLVRAKKNRLEKLLSHCMVQTADQRLNTALAWARLSLDALVMNQRGRGIYAGLPWFANYWGRDTCISLPGATWVTGQFSLAREILASLARHQDRRRGSATYGRIPNLLEPGTRIHNTADGTLWFVRQLEEYLRYTNDRKTAGELFPAVRRAIAGEIQLRTDPEGLVTHGPAETWMDAGGDLKPMTPRDNRAVEIQVLWHTALLSASRLAGLLGRPALSAEWAGLAQRVRQSFVKRYWDARRGFLYDHIHPDGTADRQIRPNALLALTVPFEPLLNERQEKAVLRFLLDHLTYAHGVGTLNPEDDQFRPRHLGHGRYHFDEAYHNGDVWLWLSGPMITALLRRGCQERALALTETMTKHILDKGAVGALSELFNAYPTAENDNEAGTFAQAWSLAEYIRVIFQDYLGVRPDLLSHRVTVEPAIPTRWGEVRFQFAISTGRVDVHYGRKGRSQIYHFRPRDLAEPVELHLRLRWPGGRLLTASSVLRSGHAEQILVQPVGRRWRLQINGRTAPCHIEQTHVGLGRADRPPGQKQ